MGLFSKKEVCPVCGRKIKGDVLIKIRDNVPLCRDCSAAINMETTMIPYQTPDSIRAHLDYREANQDKFDSFESNLDLKAGAAIFRVDESQKLWYCTTNKRDKNPPVFTYDEIADYQYTENGEPYVPEEKKSGLAKLFGGKKEPVMIHSMKLHIDLQNPYTHNIDIEMMSLNDEIKSNSFAYKSNKKAIDRVIEALDGMTGRNTYYIDSADDDYDYEEASAEVFEEATDEASDEAFLLEDGDMQETSDTIPDTMTDSWQETDSTPSLEFGEEDESAPDFEEDVE